MAEYNATAAALAAAHEEPILRIGSLVYRGRLLSIEEWLPFYERMVALEQRRAAAPDTAAAPEDLRATIALWVDFLRAMFSRRYRFWAPDPVTWLRKQPGAELRKAFYHFSFLQARALGWDLAGLQTDGMSSSGSTPGASSDV